MHDLERIHWIGGIAPNADAFTGTISTDIFEVLGEGAVFMVWYGTNASVGASTATVVACDNNSPSNTSAVAFYYRISSTFDTWGSWTYSAATGITVGGSADSMWQIYVDAAELASAGYGYVRLTMVESVAQAADGMVLAGVVNPPVQPQSYSLID